MSVSKRTFNFHVYSFLLVASALLFQSCCRTGLHFSGKVVSKSGDAVSDATVQVGKREATTDRDGNFRICVDLAEKYMVNVSKLKFGSVSKLYRDTASNIVITLSKATVVTADPNQDIVVEDVQPDMMVPAAASGEPPASPLDTVPFVFNARGRLTSFKMPAALKATVDGIQQFQAPRRGARIAIPARSLTLDGVDNFPDGDVQVSVNTIDLYSPDGMPGDNTVDLGGGKVGAMVSYGAANIEAYYNGKPLQLGEGKTATLSIPVDTLSILSREKIPDEIPFLVYDRESGLWRQEGTARLNEERTAYTRQVRHFSTFNMDLVWTNQSCVQLCDAISDAAAGTTNAIDITVAGKTKRKVIPDPTVCSSASGATDCKAYGIDQDDTHAVINLPNNAPVMVQVYKNASPSGAGGTLAATYVFNSGDGVGGTAQVCNFNSCAGPFMIGDQPACFENSPLDGTMKGPILAINRIDADDFVFSWIYIKDVDATTGAINSVPLYYKIQYSENEDFSIPAPFLEFSAGVVEEMIPAGTWKIEKAVTLQPGILISETSPVYFRVVVSEASGGTFINGAKVYVNDLPDPTAFNPCTGIGTNNN